jgi:hypothetical protein
MNTKPQPKPAFKAWSFLINKRVMLRLKTGVTVRGICKHLRSNVLTLSDAGILEREGQDFLVIPNSVSIDCNSISFAIEQTGDK